jgi:broad specificity polyphosphatase/5'/3'-nucleotidase SurE
VTSRWAPPAVDGPGTDIAAIAAGDVTITPLALDQTAYTALPKLIAIGLEMPIATP